MAGRGVSLASRVVDAATPGEVWVTRTVTELVAGCGLTFEPRGDHTLKGFPDPVTLLAAVDAYAQFVHGRRPGPRRTSTRAR